VQITLLSGKKQTIVLRMPSAITKISVASGDASIESSEQKESRKVSLPADESVTLDIGIE
jgi:hypothetical protein